MTMQQMTMQQMTMQQMTMQQMTMQKMTMQKMTMQKMTMQHTAVQHAAVQHAAVQHTAVHQVVRPMKPAMVTEEAARDLAGEWVAAWNCHDIDAILDLYRDDVEFASPFVRRRNGDADAVLRGRHAVGEYFASALDRFPQLRFDLQDVVVGVGRVTLYYRSVLNLQSVETMFINGDGQVWRVEAEYRPMAA